jgi:O-antigen ligase
MPTSTILFALGFSAVCVAALFNPIWGVVGYTGDYNIGPQLQWWEKPLEGLGIRYSFVLAAFTGVGMVLHIRNLRCGRPLLSRLEFFVLLMLGCVWLSVLLGGPTQGRYTVIDHPSVKFTKVVIFAMMLTHVVTTRRRFDILMWALVIGSLVLGYQAFNTPRAQFNRGRLETVGGPDFREANVLAAYLAGMLPLIGAQFLRSKWLGKAVCMASGALAVNAIVLTRSRGAMVGLVVAMGIAVLFAPRRHRMKILACLIVAAVGGWMLTDPGFWLRASTVTGGQDQYDSSTQSRWEIWQGGLRMFKAHPLGVGVGNFYQTIGSFAREHQGRDAHNSFIRCLCELGFQGITVYMAVLAGSIWSLWRVMQRVRQLPEAQQDRTLYACYGALVSIFTLLGCSLTVTLLYLEGMWWILLLPVCLRRVEANLLEEQKVLAVAQTPPGSKAPRGDISRFRRRRGTGAAPPPFPKSGGTSAT